MSKSKRELIFTKMVAAGNDFVVVDNRSNMFKGSDLVRLSVDICRQKYGAGADGLLAIEDSNKADFRMRIFNADGSEAEMCGNGARCFALYCAGLKKRAKARILIETMAGNVASEVNNGLVKVNLTSPKGLKLDIPITINDRTLRVNFINTGVPHAVIFVQGLDKIDVNDLGRQIRYHSAFAPAGTNVNFVDVLSHGSIRIRTYERGVEAETLACGTGSTASALITNEKLQGLGSKKTSVFTAGGEVLKVYFRRDKTGFSDVWLEGKAQAIYKGVYYV